MNLKYTFLIAILALSACNKSNSKAADNLKSIQDTTKDVDTKKKAILNHRF